MPGKALRNARTCTILVALAATALVTTLSSSPASAEVTAVDGGAFGAQASVTLVALPPATLAATPTVSLPSTGGGPFTDSVASVNLTGILSTGVLDISTAGGNLNSHAGYATSSASVADVDVLSGVLTADVIASTCTSNGDGSSASTTLTNASVSGGSALAVNPAPNTVVTLPGVGTITLNEQTGTDVVGSISTITVTAIHVHLTGVLASGDVYISRSVCEVTGPDVLTDPPVTPVDPPTGPTDPGTPTATPGTPTDPPAAPATPTTATPRFTG